MSHYLPFVKSKYMPMLYYYIYLVLRISTTIEHGTLLFLRSRVPILPTHCAGQKKVVLQILRNGEVLMFDFRML